MIFPHQPEKVYVVGAAGFWLDRAKSVPKPIGIDVRRKQLGAQLAAYLAERRRIALMNDLVLPST